MENKEGNMETINYISHTHNPKVVGSNPAPATSNNQRITLVIFFTQNELKINFCGIIGQ